MRAFVLPFVLAATGCAALPRWGGDAIRPRLLGAIRVSASVDAGLSAEGVRAFCASRWRLDTDTLHVDSATPAQEQVSVRCNGEPVLLARPTCTLTAHEAIWYAASTPVVAIRCPYGAAGYVTGFSKAQRGKP